MSELLSAAAAVMGLPEPLVQRSAAARAAETGATVDEVLTAWAGGGDIPATGVSGVPEPTVETAPPAEPPSEEAAPSEEPEASPAPPVPTTPAPVAATVATPPAEVTSREAAHLPEVITVPTAGIRERTNTAIPRWLTSLLLATPLIALFALGGAATGECGEATELRTDVITGEIVDCDGSEFTGRTPATDGQDFIAIGGTIYAGGAVGGVNCSSCHGAQGQGGVALPMTGVITTFGACSDHIEWVNLGTTGFQNAGRGTYGDTDKPVGGGGVMPGFGGALSEEQLAAVVAFERVRFGGGDTETVLVDCGLADVPDGGDGEEPGEGPDEDPGMTEARDPSAAPSTG